MTDQTTQDGAMYGRNPDPEVGAQPHRCQIPIRTFYEKTFGNGSRLPDEDLRHLWVNQEGNSPPFLDARDLARIKMTQREKDYPVIGELARLMANPGDQLLYSRSAFDLIRLCRDHPEMALRLVDERPLLNHAIAADADPDLIAEALDAERRSLIKADAMRISLYEKASAEWRGTWPGLHRKIAGLPLHDSHAIVVEEAIKCLPKNPAL